MIFGYTLIAVGFYWLLASMGLIPEIAAQYFWPILLIILGVFVVYKKQNQNND